jgi:hypothetical protein
VKVTVKGQLAARLKKARARMDEMEELAVLYAEDIAVSSRTNIETSTDVYGEPFAELAPSTIEWKRKRGYDERPLIRTMALIDSIAARTPKQNVSPVRGVRSVSVSVGFRPWYGRLHNRGEGGMIQRQFMGARQADVDREQLRAKEFAISMFGP